MILISSVRLNSAPYDLETAVKGNEVLPGEMFEDSTSQALAVGRPLRPTLSWKELSELSNFQKMEDDNMME